MSIIIEQYSKNILFELLNADKLHTKSYLDLVRLLEKNECSLLYVEDEFDDPEISAEYNIFYSKTFLKYPRLTKRIHFFKDISFNENYFIGDEFFIIDSNSFEKSYLGYITVRPFSKNFIFGPSFLRFPTLLEKSDVSIKKVINFNGDEILLEGIPFIQQDGHLFSSVESCIWIFLELLKTQSTDFTLDYISKKLYNREFIYNPHNQLGVTTDKIVNFFQEIGYGCHLYEKNVFGFDEIQEQLIFMLDSRIPVLSGFMKDDIIKLVIFIGYKEDENNKRKFIYFDPHQELINEISPKDLKIQLYSLITVNPKHLFFEYRFPEPLIDAIKNLWKIDTSRYLTKKRIVKSKKFKKYVAFSTMENDLKALYLNSRFPEDTLLIQFYKQDSKSAYGEILLDPTSIEYGLETCLFAHLENKLIVGPLNGNGETLIIKLNSKHPYQSYSQFVKGDFTIKQLPTIGVFRTKIDNSFFKEIISKFKRNTVLVLGKDTGEELQVLRNIQKVLADLNYDSIIVKDLDDEPSQSNEEKVRLCAQLARFTILENSYPSGQIAELSKICSTSRIVTAVVREKNKGSSYMVTDYDIDYKHIKEFEYNNPKDLETKIKLATEWAESFIAEKIEYLNKIYYWRK